MPTRHLAQSQTIVPVPDPSILTTEQLDKSVANIKETFAAQRSGDRELMLEKFRGVADKFGDGDKALQAALSSAKEAVAKSEDNFIKQIDGLQKLISSQKEASDDKINAQEKRITAMESQAKGGTVMAGWFVSAIMALVAIASLVFAISTRT